MLTFYHNAGVATHEAVWIPLMNYNHVSCTNNDCVGQLGWLQGEAFSANALGSIDFADGKSCLVYELSSLTYESQTCTDQALYICEYDCGDTGYLSKDTPHGCQSYKNHTNAVFRLINHCQVRSVGPSAKSD